VSNFLNKLSIPLKWVLKVPTALPNVCHLIILTSSHDTSIHSWDIDILFLGQQPPYRIKYKLHVPLHQYGKWKNSGKTLMGPHDMKKNSKTWYIYQKKKIIIIFFPWDNFHYMHQYYIFEKDNCNLQNFLTPKSNDEIFSFQ
jgi:hypothetical protein